MSAITVTDLGKTYIVPEREGGVRAALAALVRRRTRAVEAVSGVSFSVEPGEIVGFLGPNGAGKTTTLKMLAMVLRFMVEWCLALAAFWLTKVTAINSLFFALSTFFGGVFTPLAVLPGWMQTIAMWTPFSWSLAFPVEVLLGRRAGVDVLLGYAAQLAWIAVALAGLSLLWRRATRRYSAVGA
jgi:ABC-type uncharacterized transport system permease subunit